MPIEIRELHIKVAVNDGRAATANAQPGAASGAAGEPLQQAIVAECVEQVLRILQNRTER